MEHKENTCSPKQSIQRTIRAIKKLLIEHTMEYIEETNDNRISTSYKKFPRYNRTVNSYIDTIQMIINEHGTEQYLQVKTYAGLIHSDKDLWIRDTRTQTDALKIRFNKNNIKVQTKPYPPMQHKTEDWRWHEFVLVHGWVDYLGNSTVFVKHDGAASYLNTMNALYYAVRYNNGRHTYPSLLTVMNDKGVPRHKHTEDRYFYKDCTLPFTERERKRYSALPREMKAFEFSIRCGY